MTICTHSWMLYIPTNMGYFNRIRHSVIVPMFHRIGLSNFLETSDLVRPLRSPDMYIIVRLWWRSSFALNILQRRGREVQSRRHDKIHVQSSSNHMWNWCHVILMPFERVRWTFTRYQTSIRWFLNVSIIQANTPIYGNFYLIQCMKKPEFSYYLIWFVMPDIRGYCLGNSREEL